MNNHPALQLAASSIIFGIGSIFVVFIQLDSVMIAFYRLFIGAILFGIVLLFQHQPLRINATALFFASLSGVMLGVDLTLWNTSILYVGPGIATILNSLQVFCMAGFGIVLYKNKPSTKLWISLIVSFLGVVLLCSQEINASHTGLIGVMTGIASALAFAISMLALRQTAQHQQYSLINTMFYASIAGALALGLYALVSNKTFYTDDISSWVMMIIYGSVVHVLAWWLMAKSLPLLSLAIAGLLVCLEPIVVIFIDVSLLHKTLSVWQMSGAIMTISAIYLGTQSGKK